MLAAIVAGFMIGGLWYGPLFGRAWVKAMGWTDANIAPPTPAEMRKAMLLQILGLVLMVYVFTHSLLVWIPSSWGGADAGGPAYGVMGAFFTWIGFYVPLQLNKVGWERRPWKLFAINAGHDFVQLMILAQILVNWR